MYISQFKVTFCKHDHCRALQMPHERNSSKCCADGKVDLKDYFDRLQKEPDELFNLRNNILGEAKTKNFLKNVWSYNAEMAFGSLVITSVSGKLH